MSKYSLILAGLFIFFSFGLWAQQSIPAERTITEFSEINSSSLIYYLAETDSYIKAPEIDMQVRITISGMIARVRFTQTFSNPYDNWLTGTYAFPLPETAAINKLQMFLQDKMIEGVIMEKQEAKQAYDEALASGKKASLLEQNRPNIFTMSVANIPPNDKIKVELEYQQTLEPDDGEYSLRFPLVITPRYSPLPEHSNGFLTHAQELPAASDSSLVIPVHFNLTPLLDKGNGKRNPVDIKVDLNAGFPIKAISSLYHQVDVNSAGSGAYTIALAGGAVPADRDFVLVWKPAAGSEPEACLFIEEAQAATYCLLMVNPPAIKSASKGTTTDILPRETIYIIDTSGSMEGSSIQQAKAALQIALRQMTNRDTINVIAYNDQFSMLYDSCRPVDKNTYQEAVQFVNRLSADGGTEMQPALKMALSLPYDRARLEQVVFITDGAVSNEQELFTLIKQKLGERRLFTIGIGSAPNSYFMRKAAMVGKGFSTYIGSLSEVEGTMSKFFTKISEPLMQNVQVFWSDSTADSWPPVLPDLYAGQPVVIISRLLRSTGKVTVKGEWSGLPWSEDLALASGLKAEGISTLWARKKIDALLDQAVDGVSDEVIKSQVLPLSLSYHLMSPYTSFVAVEQVISKPAGEESASGNVPLNPPAGWQPPNSLMKLAGTATPADFYLLLGGLLVLLPGVVLLLRQLKKRFVS